MSGLAFVSHSKTKEMKFDVPKVKRHLVDHGKVYTVRKGGPRDGGDAELTALIEGLDVYVKHVGRCVKRKITRIYQPKDLMPYLSFSGFQTVNEWWSWIRKFGAENGTLWEVTTREREEGLERWIN